MEDNIFVLDRDGALREMKRSGFASEDIFQELLAKHPALLRKAAGNGGRLLLITREQGVPEEMGGSGRWSLDHLFVDTDGVPVFVEVKRAEDTRARREVVAQMLDYAANGVAFWQIGGIVSAFNATATESGYDPDQLLMEFLESDDPTEERVEAFWKGVEANIQSGRIRMLFVADRISKELTRIIEFLNGQMRSAEMLAIELKHFTDGTEVRTIVPRLIGATERAETAKAVAATSRGPMLSLEEGMDQMAAKRGQDTKTATLRAIEWFRSQGCSVDPSKKSGASACVTVLAPDGTECWPFFVNWVSGSLEFDVRHLQKSSYYASIEARQELVATLTRKLTSAPSLSITPKAADGYPWMSVAELLKPEVWTGFMDVASEIIKHIRKGT